METIAPQERAIPLRIDMVAPTVTMTVGLIPMIEVNGALFGPPQTEEMHFGKTRLSGQTMM